MPRLNRALVADLAITDRLKPDVALPRYDVEASQSGIVHLGLGAFARAHLAHYTESVLAQCGGDWRILGVSLRHTDVAEQLVPQDSLYTVVEQGSGAAGAADRCRVMAAISGVLVARENPGAVLDAIDEDGVRIVSLTVTEKGYCHNPASGALQLDHPDIVWDLQHLDQPRTAVGFIVAGLSRRFVKGRPAFTPLSLDNLSGNGALLKRLCLEFATVLDPTLAAKIEAVDFPSTMVDRIVPATTEADRATLAATLGYVDLGMVKSEPFSQWVIEDRFVSGRPDWNLGGALFVDEVEPFETMKLRLLNGSHSAIAYLGALAGYDFVHEVVSDAALNRFITELMVEELAPTLVAPPGISLTEYQADLMERFANPALAHRTMQIAMDGSQKLPPRVLAPLRVRLANGQTWARLALVVAGWLRFVEQQLTAGGSATLSDPIAAELESVLLRYPGDVAARVRAYLQLNAVFGTDLAENAGLAEGIHEWLQMFESGTVSEVVAVCGDGTATTGTQA